MRIVIASGKGGTGKTTVATNLAVTAAMDGRKVHLLDCDVEQPNCALFVKPEIQSSQSIEVPVPVVNNDLCRGHGECADFCEFNALACIGGKVIVFTELCHSCGGCWMVCPEKAISRGARPLGVLEQGTAMGMQFTQGRLRVGEAMAVPLIQKVKAAPNGSDLAILDSPPGTSCPVIATMRGADYVLLVTEPTPFGLNDLTLAVETVRQLELPYGVVVNRAGSGDDRVHRYCRDEKIPILLEIPDNRKIAEAYSEGHMAVSAVAEAREMFQQLYHRIHAWCREGVA
jgi:MinD superfamily P-loop ATPase